MRSLFRKMLCSIFGLRNTYYVALLARKLTKKITNLAISIKRPLETNFYRSEKLALGEQRSYGFPSSWVLVDREDSDFNVNLSRNPILPFKDETKSVIFSAHTFEHLGFESVELLLRECFRVLKPSGSIKIEVPDGELAVKRYCENDADFIRTFKEQNMNLHHRFGLDERLTEDHIVLMNFFSFSYPCLHESGAVFPTHVPVPAYAPKEIMDEKLNSLSLKEFIDWAVSLQSDEERDTGGHQCGFSFDILRELLEKAGFCNIKKMQSGETEIPTISTSFKLLGKNHRKFFSLYVEAQRP